MKTDWISKANVHHGALKQQLGIDEKDTIPEGLLNSLANADIGTTVQGHKVTSLLKKRATLAKSFKKMKK